MSRRWLLFLLCLALSPLVFVQFSRAGGALKVNEAATRFSLRDENPQLLLAIENGVGKSFNAVVRLELVTPEGHIKATGAPHFNINAGSQRVAITIPLKLAELNWRERSRLLWYRVRYQISPELDAHVEPVSGTISLSEITPELFELRVASSRLVREGLRYRATIRAQHPLTNRPARGVQIEGSIECDDDTDETITIKARGLSNGDGFAILDFDLPHKIKSDDIELTIKGVRASVTAEEYRSIDLPQEPFIFVSSDKPMYQPGQVLHARVLMFGPTKRAIANAPVTLEISDPENEVLFRSELTTSKFGVASADWSIAARSKLGRYKIEFITNKDGDEHRGSTSVKISRYDLPNFTVNVKTDHPYYLPDQNAEVEIAATYLFGQPVKRGKVRVVRETERTWDYREQKYETTEAEQYEGETDSNGLYKARIDLRAAHSAISDSDYRRFEDLRFAAYFTDPTTNRTEQRRFDLRITKEAIHVYVVKSDDRYYENSRLPLQFYVSTSYADGSPAQCRVVISDDGQEKPGSKHVLRTVKTNRYGLAQVKGIEIPASPAGNTDLVLNFLASDSRGQSGKHGEGFNLRDEPAIRVETDKSLYRAGEPVEIAVTSSDRNLIAMLEVAREGIVVHSEVVRLRDGRAVVMLPWTKDLTDQLAITVYTDGGDDDGPIGRRNILFPRNRELKLGIQANHKEYRPGEDAQFSFRVRDPQGHSAESALGVVVFDKAVEERARTDEEFGANHYDSANDILRMLGSGDAIAGVNLKSLNSIDLSKPIAADQDLVAEVLLNQGRTYYPYFFGGDGAEKRPAKVFGDLIKGELKPVREALQTRYEATGKYPTDETSLRQILSESPVDYAALRDPWGTPFRASFFVEQIHDSMTLTSAGADKTFDTSDDFIVETFGWPYFRALGETIDRAVRDYHHRTGGFIRDRQALRDQLMKLGVDLDVLRDHWAQPYKINFDISMSLFVIKVFSSGPNRKFESDVSVDDFQLWTSSIDYFADQRAAIDTALSASLKATHHFPQNDTELRTALQPAGIALDKLRDAWGRRYYSTFQEHAFYGDKAKIEMQSNSGKTPKQVISIKPVTKRILTIALRSSGPDSQEGTWDDFTAASFTAMLSEQGAADQLQKPSEQVIFAGSTGAISGTVTDPNGAVVPGASVEATREGSTLTYETTTDDEGRYLLRNLPAGLYTIRLSAPGFQQYEVIQVVVNSSNVIEVNASLSVGSATATVEITAGAASVNITNSTMVRTVQHVTVLGLGRQQVSTPRLREYFPETLLWQPALETDKQGRAQLKFKLADNITTWKMAVIGSTEDGQIGTVEREIKSFQPFFVEHDPPRILTEGDEISLPVVVRNYLERAQPVDLEIKPESWFALLGAAHKRAQVPAGDAARETFDFRAQASVTDGKQRIIATAADDSDAIEKPVTVHPDGEEQSATAGDIVRDQATLTLEIPAAMIPNSAQGELKIYPNLMAHVAESAEAIMRRPGGCGEQTISSTYPSLLLVRNFKATGQNSPLRVRAERYLSEGYNRLLNYRGAGGGFTYWGRGEPDLALTAYALRFLTDAGSLLPVDEEVIAGARTWLVKQQRADGSWAAFDYGMKVENKRRTVLLTAYIARVLARTLSLSAPQSDKTGSELKRSLDYLATRVAEIDEPYLIASYALAASDAGSPTHAAAARTRLAFLAHSEGDSSYWTLETNTPFYGWGLTGRVESTALAVQALARGCKAQGEDSGSSGKTQAQSVLCNPQLVNRGLLFLLKQKDRYGVWYSSQATINVLDAMLVVLAQDAGTSGPASASPTAEIIVNGKSAKSIELPSESQLAVPFTVDISSYLRAGSNQVEIRRAHSASPASVQAVATYYVPWSSANATPGSSLRTGGSSGLRLVTRFDRTEGNVSDAISCHVEAERIGFKGYGMMLAEIGLPPGADVDRASLENAMKDSDWAISQYDILPDRVVVYLWPPAGGVKFDFKFRPRFGLRAKTAPSSIYDYYNPESRAVVAPTSFVVR